MTAPNRNNRLLEIPRSGGRGKITLYFCLLFAGLFLLHRPTFRYPPRSDYWSAFWVFQQLDADPRPLAWTGVLTFDLWQHGTYRPLSHLVPYLQHRLFGPRFIWNHIANFAGYCLSLILLYLLAMKLSLDRTLTAVFLAVFAFLFSHFDILAWTFQLFTILGFCCFLLGFILHIDYLRTRRTGRLFPVAVLFLLGMWTSEVYALWPAAILLLPLALTPRPRPCFRGRDAAFLLVYLPYLGGWLLHRATGGTGPLPSPAAAQLGAALLLAFFNLLYTGVAVNIFPALARPVFFDDNMNLGGFLLSRGEQLEPLALWTGGAAILLLLLAGGWLIRKGRRRPPALLAFFLFLYLSNFFTVAAARLTTNRTLYPLTQFRYQYIPNALLALTLAAGTGLLFRPRGRGKIIIILILTPVLIFNIALVGRQVADLGMRLAPLRLMLDNIRRGLDSGMISEKNRLHIAAGVPDRIPPPGWNRNMARFMEGNFQWFFPAREMGKFSLKPQSAAWIITEESFPEIGRNPAKGN